MSETRILIVDDDRALLEALPEALRLRMNDVRVDVSDSAPAALELLAETDYDAVVTDIKMPGMDGLHLLREIQARRPRTPTLLITGHGEHDLAVQALRGGAYDFVQKPIDREYFVASLRRAIDMRRLDREVEQQKQALERHARVLERVGDGVFLVDTAGTIQLWNRAAEAITALDASSVLGQPAEDVLPGWREIAPIVPVAASPGAEREGARTVPLDLADHRELWISISGVEGEDGTIYAFRNVTSERMVDELKDEFVATVSHELRTPLAAIYGAAQTLRRDDSAVDEEARRRLLGVIATESDRLARIVNEILVAAQIDRGRLHVTRELLDPAEIARHAVEVVHSSGDSPARVELVEQRPLPPIATDPLRLRQVLINLLDNAIKYSPEGGTVELAIDVEDGRLRFAVRDQGIGIPIDEQRRIFGKFYRLDPEQSGGIGGTGLGLYICRELVHRMGGRITVSSRPGRGSTFAVELPAADAAPGAGAPAEFQAATSA